MYRIKEIQSALLHLVGWSQNFNPARAIDDELCLSESGLVYQGAHPLCTLDNIRSVMPDDFGYVYPLWDAAKVYEKDKKVRTVQGNVMKIWIAVRENTGSEPSESSSDWKTYNMFSDYIQMLTENGIAKMVQRFVTEKQLEKETRSLVDHRTFFDGAARLKATIDPKSKIVGFEIIPVRAMGVTMKINRIGLQFVGGVGTIKLYLFHSSQYEPIRTIEVNYTNERGGFQWFNFDDDPIYLPYIGTEDDGTDAGGAWFLCYCQDELPEGMYALNVSKDWSREPCGTCNIGSVETWREITKYMMVSPFSIQSPEDFSEYPGMFDIERVTYTNTMNYGLNCEVSVECDLTDFIISQKHIFANVLQKQVTYDALRTMALNPDVRVNRNQSNVSRMDILYELDGNTASARPSGLGWELKQAYKALNLDTEGMSRICLSCNNHGVKYRSV